MPQRDAEVLITQSLLDRLVDRSKDAGTQNDAAVAEPRTHHESLRRLKEGVKRDLEWLLNTRQGDVDVPDESELNSSLLRYGLPDTSTLSLNSKRDRDRLHQVIQSTVMKFEPRITQVCVSMDSDVAEGRVLRFRIEGVLRVEPEPEPVTFNTTLELASGQYQVK